MSDDDSINLPPFLVIKFLFLISVVTNSIIMISCLTQERTADRQSVGFKIRVFDFERRGKKFYV